MRKTERIDPFLNEIGRIWKEKCPDWRFGQIMVNFLPFLQKEVGDIWFPEEEEFLLIFKKYFNDTENPTQEENRNKNNDRNQREYQREYAEDDSFEI